MTLALTLAPSTPSMSRNATLDLPNACTNLAWFESFAKAPSQASTLFPSLGCGAAATGNAIATTARSAASECPIIDMSLRRGNEAGWREGGNWETWCRIGRESNIAKYHSGFRVTAKRRTLTCRAAKVDATACLSAVTRTTTIVALRYLVA